MATCSNLTVTCEGAERKALLPLSRHRTGWPVSSVMDVAVSSEWSLPSLRWPSRKKRARV
jgi:hypothetical protein